MLILALVYTIDTDDSFLKPRSFNDFTLDRLIHGHHVYKELWAHFVSKELILIQGNGNLHGQYIIYCMKKRIWLLAVFPI